jgi:predicted nucleic acid-binding protein
MKSIIALVLLATLAACGTQMKVAEVDDRTGLLKSDRGPIDKATVVVAKRMSLAPYKSMAFMSNTSDWGLSQMKAIKYFDQVMSYDDLQKLVIAKKLQDKVPSLNEPIGLNRLYRENGPFLWIHFKQTQRDTKRYMQLIATDPDTLDDVFVSEVVLDLIWRGVNDQNSRYPLVNALIEWINANRA